MSSAADPTAAFLANLRTSGVLSPAQLQEIQAWVEANQPNVQAVAREVNRREWLTVFQIKEVFRGRGRDLILDRYVLLDLLGEGGMGRVYQAHDTRMGRDVAVKIIRRDKLTHPAAASRFKQEIEALGKMAKHPNVINVLDANLEGRTHFYAMEYINGGDLTKMVRDRGPLPVAEACEYLRHAALGLQHASDAGLVHRDIKPSNILVSRDRRVVKLVDLGLARLMENEDAAGGEDGHRITQEGFVIGTPDFLAPEQARNPMAVDIRADIYALGGTLYYILTGKVPYDGANPTEKLLKHCTEPPPNLRAIRPDSPPELERLIHWCMAKSADNRPQTPLQLALALQPFCPRPEVPATPVHSGGPHAAFPARPYAPVPAYPYPVANPAPLSLPPPDEERPSQIFKLPQQESTTDPIRRRGESGFPWGVVLLFLGLFFVGSLLSWAAYKQFMQSEETPPESFTNSEGMRVVKLPGGKFRMGSMVEEVGHRANEGPEHEVTITGPLLIGATEVSHSQFLRVMGSSPSISGKRAHKTQNLPVESVTWDDANAFCKKLTEVERGQPWSRKGWAYRLPTEAEWEYAARAGSEHPFAFGPRVIFGKQAVYLVTEDDPLGIGDDQTKPLLFPSPIGSTDANAFGLQDMHGNVAEWCSDWYKPVYPDTPQTDPTGPPDGDSRVVRGGSFKTPSTAIRSASRELLRPDRSRDDVGFRVVYAPVEIK